MCGIDNEARSAPSEAGAPVSGLQAAPSLVINVSSYNSNSERVSEWTRQQKRGYHRVRSLLEYWISQGYQILWVCLTTSEVGSASNLARHHQRLRQMIERRLDYPNLQHFTVRTSEGNGTLHIFWAWKPADGFRRKSFYVDQGWLSNAWSNIHGAQVVWVKRVKKGHASVNKVAKYAVSQYVADQKGYEYMSWSWGRTFGFGLVGCWNCFKRRWFNCNRGEARRDVMLKFWESFMQGQYVPWFGNISAVKRDYEIYGSETWSKAYD